MSDLAQYVTLGIAEEIFAAPVEHVQEILESRVIARLPHAPTHFLGMIDVRGQGIPVIDLRVKLGLPQVVDTENTRIIVLQVTIGDRNVTLGLKTDRVFEVTVLDEAALQPPPEIGARWRSDCIVGIGRRHGAFVTVLDLNHLFADGEVNLSVRPYEAGEAA